MKEIILQYKKQWKVKFYFLIKLNHLQINQNSKYGLTVLKSLFLVHLAKLLKFCKTSSIRINFEGFFTHQALQFQATHDDNKYTSYCNSPTASDRFLLNNATVPCECNWASRRPCPAANGPWRALEGSGTTPHTLNNTLLNTTTTFKCYSD